MVGVRREAVRDGLPGIVAQSEPPEVVLEVEPGLDQGGVELQGAAVQGDGGHVVGLEPGATEGTLGGVGQLLGEAGADAALHGRVGALPGSLEEPACVGGSRGCREARARPARWVVGRRRGAPGDRHRTGTRGRSTGIGASWGLREQARSIDQRWRADRSRSSPGGGAGSVAGSGARAVPPPRTPSTQAMSALEHPPRGTRKACPYAGRTTAVRVPSQACIASTRRPWSAQRQRLGPTPPPAARCGCARSRAEHRVHAPAAGASGLRGEAAPRRGPRSRPVRLRDGQFAWGRPATDPASPSEVECLPPEHQVDTGVGVCAPREVECPDEGGVRRRGRTLITV